MDRLIRTKLGTETNKMNPEEIEKSFKDEEESEGRGERERERGRERFVPFPLIFASVYKQIPINSVCHLHFSLRFVFLEIRF